MNIKMILTTAVVASGLSLWGGEACKGPECPNVVKLDLSTVQSWDPNEIKGPEGVGEPRYVQTGDWMDYTIYFENKAEATAAAQEVFVTLPKDPSLDWDTLELGEVAFGANIDSGLNGKANGESTYYLSGSDGQVRTKVTVTDTEVKWYLRSWDPNTIDNFPADATAGFLPQNDATGRGEGHVRYRVRVKGAVAMGTVARACATIVFDQNDPITTDPAWWNTIGVMQQVAMTIDGVTTNLNLFVGMPYGELPTPRSVPAGYTFGGWFTGKNGTGREVTATTLVAIGENGLFAKWTPNVAIVEFEGLEPVQSVTDAEIVIPEGPSRTGYAFGGWKLADRIYLAGEKFVVPPGGASFKSVYALRLLTDGGSKTIDVANGEVAPYVAGATVYDGYLLDDGVLAGTIQVKVSKTKKDKTATVAATVQMANGSKKMSFKKGVAQEDGSVSIMSVGGHELALSLGVDAFGGTLDERYIVDGVRNIFSSKADKTLAAEVIDAYKGVYNIAGEPGTLSVSVAAKGKVKVTGTWNTIKVNATSQLLVGESACIIPVVVVKKLKLAFNIWMTDSGATVSAIGLDDVEIGKAGTLKSGAAFRMDGVALSQALPGLLTDYLPGGLSVAQSGTKWIVAGGAKAGKLVLLKGTSEINREKSKFTDNMSGLKLTYKSKDGSFKGSFKAYAVEGTKLKSYTANVTGVMIESKGYGTATIKKVGSVGVNIE